MSSATRLALPTAALTALAFGATAALAAPVSAAPNTTPEKVCGTGYKTVNSTPVGSLGTVYLTYNASTGKNCVATIRTNPGAAVDVSAWVYVPDTDEYHEESGSFTSYAGPVYATGKGHCVNWGGHIQQIHVQVDGSNCGRLQEQKATFTR
ncbi:spore-associated protein [Yinghuangia sp. ASG 101]|uniref:spore-associated protein n=1 Tax=Yinghuangia sp. ASG 101 TaxID=2896848 RepID=UPI001E504F1C|nr:spore-associated protein [Yinghuangia sp. ASG 101]UGQ11914.1 spore-associated protein [Yinghuangia sp. ASG 101]